MARPRKDITTNKKTTANKVSKPKKATTKTKLVSPAALPVSGSSIIFHRLAALPQKVKLPKLPLKVVLPIIVLVILGVLVVLAQKYLVLAWVDNRPVTIFSYYQSLSNQYGSQVKSELIREQLIFDEAQRRGVTISDQEVEAQVKTYQDQSQGIDNFNQALAAQGLTLDTLKHQIKLQLLVQKMFGSSTQVTDDEINKYISEHKDQLPADITDSVKGSIKQQLQQQKLVDAFQNWLASAEKSSRVQQ